MRQNAVAAFTMPSQPSGVSNISDGHFFSKAFIYKLFREELPIIYLLAYHQLSAKSYNRTIDGPESST